MVYFHWFGGAQPLHMKKTKTIRFVESLILLPLITMSGSASGMPNKGFVNNKDTSPIVFLQKQNNDGLALFGQNQAIDEESKILKIKANAIDTYFKERDMPLYGTGMKMVMEAEKNGLDWRLIAAISVRESTGGKFECKKADFNAFGWGSCKINFKSDEEAIETVARNLGGNNPNTSHHYGNKTTIEILRAYNPPSVVKRYAEQVIAIMDTIGDEEVTLSENS
jgi:hypothetical protein